MEPLAFAVITEQEGASHEPYLDLAHSALPAAPIVAHVEKAARFVRSRSALAAALRRLADVTAPAAERHRATYAVR